MSETGVEAIYKSLSYIKKFILNVLEWRSNLRMPDFI